MAHRYGRPVAISGTMGGPAHPQINTWSLVRSLHLGMTPAEAVAAPRWLVGGMDALEGEAAAEEGVPAEVADRLEEAGYALTRLGSEDSSVGHAHLIRIAADGSFQVGTDPRADGAALAS
jgi:gamma-glutamyltranspeptidase